MKCIKAIKKTKDAEVGQIKRVDDRTAYNLVGTNWMYVSKSEWKASSGRTKSKEKETDAVDNNSRKK